MCKSQLINLQKLRELKKKYHSTFQNYNQANENSYVQKIFTIYSQESLQHIELCRDKVTQDSTMDVNIKQQIMKNLNEKKLNDFQTSIDRQIIPLQQLMFSEYFLILWVNKENPQNSPIHLDEICTICQFPLFDLEDDSIKRVQDISQQHVDKVYEQVVKLDCDHYYHLQCLEQCYKDQSLQCSICNRIYGIRKGDQPDGEMLIKLDHTINCEGYEQYPTIIIEYIIPSGIRNSVPFKGTHWMCFLPDCTEGRQILRLLKIAFERKLIFTVGRSLTRGLDNQTVWNGIHHKTCVYGGTTKFGYPDPTYFSRVRNELASRGVL